MLPLTFKKERHSSERIGDHSMAVLITILKWIGILLLCLLGLIFILCLAVLFFPFSYQAKGELGDRFPEDMIVTIRLRWFFSAVGAVLVYRDRTLSGKLSILGIPVKRFPDEPGKRRKKRRKKGKAPDARTIADTDVPQETMRTEGDESISEAAPALTVHDDMPEEAEQKAAKIFLRIRRIELKIRSRIRQMIGKIRGIPGFFRALWDKLSNISAVITDEDNREAAKFVLAELLKLLKKCGPRKIVTDLSFSAGDPALTGQVLAVLSMMPFLYKDRVGIRPDFEGESLYVRGTFSMKGYIQTVSLVRTALHIYKNKQMKKIMHNIRS